MLAGGDGGQRHLLVQRVRRGDVDDVDIGARDQRAPVAGPLGEAERRGGFRGEGVGAVGDGVQDRLIGQIKDARGSGEAEDMGLAHEAGADQADPEDGLVRCHGSGLR